MGKRSDFKRVEKDFYPTPREAIIPLLPFLDRAHRYYEPCLGQGDLMRHFQAEGFHFVGGSDSELDARSVDYQLPSDVEFITNPPWSRELLHPIIANLSKQNGTWLLFDADWMHTRQASLLIQRCVKIISVGRLKWIPNSPHTGKDNCCWYHFMPGHSTGPHFYGRSSVAGLVPGRPSLQFRSSAPESVEDVMLELPQGMESQRAR